MPPATPPRPSDLHKVQFDPLSSKIIGCAIEVHRHLGPGLLESAYQRCMAKEFMLQNISFEEEVPLRIQYKGMEVECGYRLDFVVEKRIIVELKATEKTMPIHKAQVISYMKLSGITTGLLFNFHYELLKEGMVSLKLPE